MYLVKDKISGDFIKKLRFQSASSEGESKTSTSLTLTPDESQAYVFMKESVEEVMECFKDFNQKSHGVDLQVICPKLVVRIGEKYLSGFHIKDSVYHVDENPNIKNALTFKNLENTHALVKFLTTLLPNRTIQVSVFNGS